jgi:DNA primase
MSIIVNILENFLGTPRSHYDHKHQVGFDCPMCSSDKGKLNGDGKGNLAVNYKKGVYKCWSCWERNNMHGSILFLIRRYGNKQHLKDYLLVAPKVDNYVGGDEDVKHITVKFPDSFKRFSESKEYHTNYTTAYKYVKNRGLTDDILKKFQIGFTCDGKRKDRIVIPSFDINGELNYYIARSWDKFSKAKYMNPESGVDADDKQNIIFNEHLINWDSTVYLVEGAFDHIVTPNSIPILGKYISDKLFHELQTRCKSDVTIVLDGGTEEKKDTKVVYKKLNTLNLYNRVKCVYLKDGMDLSLIYQTRGSAGIVAALKTAKKLKESYI